MCKAGQSRLGSGNSALSVGHPESETRYPSGNTEKAEGEFWCKDVSQGVLSVEKVLKNTDQGMSRDRDCYRLRVCVLPTFIC